MASGPTNGGENGPREKQRYMENKVYTRKSFKGPKNKANAVNAVNALASAPPAAPNITTTINATADPTVTENYIEKKDGVDKNKGDTKKNVSSDAFGKKDAVDDDKDTYHNENHRNDVAIEPVTGAGVQEDGTSTEQPVIKRVEVVSDDSRCISHQQDEPLSINFHSRDEPSSIHRLPQDDPSGIDHHLLDEPSSVKHHYQDEPPRINPLQGEELSDINRHQQEVIPSTRQLPSGNGSVKQASEGRVKIDDLGLRSKQEISDLRKKFENELDMVRSMVRRIEARQGQIGGYRNSNVIMYERVNNGGAKRSHSEVASGGISREIIRPFPQLNVSVMENIQGGGDIVEKDKRTPKANQFYRNSDFLLGKEKLRPAESNKKSKTNGRKHGGGETGHTFGTGTKFWKSCSSLLEKLMKHKHGWVFNTPVDAEALGLHDYHSTISHPMDLGTVKLRLSTNWYKSPKEFAEDVRLTFSNAMLYNPKGQDVHIMAEQLSKIFEDRWTIIESDYNREIRHALDFGTGIVTHIPVYRKPAPMRPAPLDMRRILGRSESLAYSADRTPKPMTLTSSGRTPAPKKPKAKDPNKRDMTFEEKQKLSTNLQSLPSEKLDAIVQIIKRRNSSLFQQDDEIEVDIDSVDAETLWELDRFVTNYKKSLSKYKRKAELAIQAKTEATQSVSERGPVVSQVVNETIADEGNVSAPFPALAEKELDNGSRSNSSSSSSSDSGSSSSDSDSESSSASGSAGSQRS